jgi:ABC-type amino acid transport substrate-binding protein
LGFRLPVLNDPIPALAAISITADRETRIDFSHRYFESGLGILTRSGGSTSDEWLEIEGIDFPAGSPLREEINRALLELVENGTYDRIAHKWFGSGSGY